MTDKIARVCDGCGEADILRGHADSNGMVLIQSDDVYLLFMRDLKKGESGRPSLTLTGKAYHPKCLIMALEDWLDKVK